MATSFAAQLRTIALNSSNELDLRARRNAHAESIIFERTVAVKQDWETIYQICFEGFQELCLLDARMLEFERSLFSPQSKDQDREQLNKSENEALDIVVEQCLTRLGSKLMLRPGVKALEWLVRRFQVHVHSPAALLLTVLPYHETPLFQNVLSIVPAAKLVDEWKFLRPYHQTTTAIPRHTIVYTATNNDRFFSAFNNYTLSACQIDAAYTGLTRFWSSVVVEAVVGKLNQAKSGRKEIQRQRTEDVLLKILPLLDEGLEVVDCLDMTMACFSIAMVIASTGLLEDNVLDSLMEAIAGTVDYPEVDVRSILVCLSILCSQKNEKSVSKGVLAGLIKISKLEHRLQELREKFPVDTLALSMVRGCLNASKSKISDSRLGFLESFLFSLPLFVDQSTLALCLVAVFSKIQQISSQEIANDNSFARLQGLLQHLNDSDDFKLAFSEVASMGTQNGIDVEAILGSTVKTIEGPILSQPEPMELDIPESHDSIVDRLFKSLPTRPATVRSFLLDMSNGLFDKLVEVLQLCSQRSSDIVKFESLELWQQVDPTFYISFLIRVACASQITSLKTTALKMLAKFLESQTDLDSQILLPYVSCLLMNTTDSIRQAASSVLVAMEKAAPQSLVDGEECSVVGAVDFYHVESQEKVTWFSSTQLVKILKQVYLPLLEECVSDESQIISVLRTALNGPTTTTHINGKQAVLDVKKSLRHSLFECLSSHTLATPLLTMKLGIIRLLKDVHKVGTTTKSKAMGQVLQDWMLLSPDAAAKVAAAENVLLSEVDSTMIELVTPQDRDTVTRTVTMLGSENTPLRDTLTSAFFNRVAQIWPELRSDMQNTLAVRLFEYACSSKNVIAKGARSVLQNTVLSTEVLQLLIEHALSGAAQMQSECPPPKRRRVSQSQDKKIMTQYSDIAGRLALILDIIESSQPEFRPELLPSLFDTLLHLQRINTQPNAESPYLLNQCLSSILAILEKTRKLRKPDIDLSALRIDLVTDCVRKSENSQVQSTALLVSASLATLVPERVLHNIMPIFTFMGHNILSREDDHSIFVVNNAIDQIIPPLISTLKRQNENNLIRSSSSLLASLTSAFDHIPQHRRLGFYLRLIKRLGPEDFSFAVVALLAIRSINDATFKIFLPQLMADLSPLTQVVTYNKLIGLVADIYSDKPQNAEPLLDISSKSAIADTRRTVLRLLLVAEQILRNKNLETRVTKILKQNNEDAAAIRQEFNLSIHSTLQSIRDRSSDGNEIGFATRKCMTALLELLPLAELFRLLPDLLNDMEVTDSSLRGDVLRILAAQLRTKPVKNTQVQVAAMSYLEELQNIVRATEDVGLRQSAIACIDQICETYGRKDVDAVVAAASVLASESGLGSADKRTRLLSLLCLASMFDVMKETAVPIVPEAMPRLCDQLSNAVQNEKPDVEIHDAAYSLISAIVSHVPFMISEDYLDRILELSAESSYAGLPSENSESRQQTLSVLARKVELDMLVSSLSKTWDRIVENNVDAIMDSLDMLGAAVEHHSKSTIIRSAEQLSSLMLQIMDLRRVQFTVRDEDSYSDEEVDQVESKLNALSIIFIYKLNDTTFRPIFESWIDWAVKCNDISSTTNKETAQLLRQTTLFTFLIHFFSTLKSIVTSYTSYILSPATTILQSIASSPQSTTTTPELLLLYTRLLTTLKESFTHDADGFFNAPSHFQPLASTLTSHLSLAPSSTPKPLQTTIKSHLYPTLIALATATMDVPAHHQSLNHDLCQLRHSPHASVRLASIRMHLALTESEEVGDEWVDNIVGSGGAGAVGGSGGANAGGGAGETMVYVNEMLEDDDEEVEREVRRWVRLVREKVGEEDLFET